MRDFYIMGTSLPSFFLWLHSFLSPCQTRGCHWSGKRADRPAHQQVCLVTRINNLRLYVDELEDAILEYDKRVLDLETALYEQFGQNQDLRAEIETLKEQTDLDEGVIESLRLQLGGSAASLSMRRGELGTANDAVDNLENTLDVSVVGGHGPHGAALKFLLAAERGDVVSVKEKLNGITFIKSKLDRGHGLGTALHMAIGCVRTPVMEIGLDGGHTDVANIVDDEGNSALHVAALNGHEAVVRLLLASEEFRCVCLPNLVERTALHCAAVQGNQEIVKMLLCNDRFADGAVNALTTEDMPFSNEGVQVETEEGVTALHLAAKFGHLGAVQALVEAGRFKAVNDATVHLC